MTVQTYGWRDLRMSLVAAATGGGTPSLQTLVLRTEHKAVGVWCW